MKIIDFDRKGNVVRFYLGEKTEEWGWTNPDYKDYNGNTPDWLKPSDTYYGDDWDDTPYEHNAGEVYEWFIKGHKDIAFDFDDVVLVPCDGENNSRYSKEDMVNRLIPCIVIIPKELKEKLDLQLWEVSFTYALRLKDSIKYYFGDEI